MATTLINARSSSIGTAATAVGNYTASSQTTGTAITGLSIANTHPTLNVTVNVSLFDGTTQIYLVKNCVVLPGGSIQLADQGHRITMNANDQVLVTSSVASSVDAIMSIAQIQN